MWNAFPPIRISRFGKYYDADAYAIALHDSGGWRPLDYTGGILWSHIAPNVRKRD